MVDNSAAVGGAIRNFIKATTPYRVCEGADTPVSAIQKATERGCDLILLDLRMPNLDGAETVSLLRGKLPGAKIVGFTMSAEDLEKQPSTAPSLDAILGKEDGLSKLVDTLKALLPYSAQRRSP